MKAGNEKTLPKDFATTAKDVLSRHPELEHSWLLDEAEDRCELTISKQTNSGFDITVEVSPSDIVIIAEGFHHHLDSSDTSNEKIDAALGLVRDLLSPHMRIVELSAGGRPYRWQLEALRDGKWCNEASTGLIFWNYFGKRTKKIFQNHILPGRLGSNSQPQIEEDDMVH